MTPAGNWPARHEHGASSHNNEDSENGRVAIIRSPFHQQDENTGLYAPWRLFEERVRTGPYGLLRFPSQPHSPVRILILDDEIAEAVNPSLRQFIQNSPPRIRGDWHLGLEIQEPEELGLNQEEFKKTMKKMTKEVYKPTHQPRRGWKRGVFSNRNKSSYITNSPDDEEKNEGKQCAICLEAFVSNESVLVTPCNHMFHNDCLAPWVKSHGQCPVCRFAFSERRRESTAVTQPNNSYNPTTSIADYQLANDLIFLIRAMEEAFNWINHSPNP